MGHLVGRPYRNCAHQLTPELTRGITWRPGAMLHLRPPIAPFAYNSAIGAHADAQGIERAAAILGLYRGKHRLASHPAREGVGGPPPNLRSSTANYERPYAQYVSNPNDPSANAGRFYFA